jgi:superfamily II DNA/RNA helicase
MRIMCMNLTRLLARDRRFIERAINDNPRDRQNGLSYYMMFDQLGLSEKALDAVKAAGFTTPTPIQIGAIPPALERRDVLGLAQTGSGKTAAFVLPMLTMLEQGRARARMPRTLILEPTRELAAQVHEAFETLGKNHKLTISLLIGGVSFDEQSAKIDRGADVVIATPGRLLDHLGRGKLMLHGIEILVIDEADRMLDMGFIPDIERICKMLPVTRQTMFFSATMPPEIQRITSQFLHAPVRIEASPPSSTAESIVQRFVRTPDEPKSKREMLRRLLREQGEIRNAIVFANRKTTVDMLDKSLKRHGFNAAALHGDMDQRARLKTLEAFRAGEVTYLIASDVAARGLDIPEVSHIFNFDTPVHSEDYVHRIGRTGRAGREGFSFTLVSPKETKQARAIEQLIKREIQWVGEPAPEAAEAAEAEGPKPKRRSRSKAKDETGEARLARKRGKPEPVKMSAESVEPSEPSEERAEAKPRESAPRRGEPAARRGQRDGAQRDGGKREEGDGFHSGNMPAFLARPVRA